MELIQGKLKTGAEGLKALINSNSVALVGVGISNAPLVKLFSSLGATRITARDKKDITAIAQKNDFSSYGVRIISGEVYLSDLNEDIIIRTPGIRPDIKELKEARERGSLVIGEMELFLKYCPAKTIGITGSAGKTTTTTLTARFLEASGKKVFLGGNIGTPLLPRLGEMTKDDIAVCELSSFQLSDMEVSPDISIVTNISENHLDWHKDMQEYMDAKKNILRHREADGICILNAMDEEVKKFCEKNNNGVRYFSSEASFDGDGIYLSGGVFYRRLNGVTERLFSRDELLLPGKHNAENMMAAACAVSGIATDEAVKSVAMTFGGVEHRMELCGEKDGIRFYNSSIDTSPARTTAALNTFSQRIILICGGYDKNLSYTSLGPLLCEKVKVCIMCGQTSQKIHDAILSADNYKENENNIRLIRTDSFEEAVKCAYDNASSGDIIVLSPASASFDMFKNFEERARVFKELVQRIINDEN